MFDAQLFLQPESVSNREHDGQCSSLYSALMCIPQRTWLDLITYDARCSTIASAASRNSQGTQSVPVMKTNRGQSSWT